MSDWPFEVPGARPPDGWDQVERHRVRMLIGHQRELIALRRACRDDLDPENVIDRADANELLMEMSSRLDVMEAVYSAPDPTVDKVLAALADQERRLGSL